MAKINLAKYPRLIHQSALHHPSTRVCGQKASVRTGTAPPEKLFHIPHPAGLLIPGHQVSGSSFLSPCRPPAVSDVLPCSACRPLGIDCWYRSISFAITGRMGGDISERSISSCEKNRSSSISPSNACGFPCHCLQR